MTSHQPGDDQASGNLAIDAPPSASHDPTAHDNITDYSNLLPALPNVALPEFSTTLEKANPNYRPVLRSYGHATLMRQRLIATYNIESTLAHDLPNIDTDGEIWIRLLHNAVHDLSKCLESSTSMHYKTIANGTHYSEGVMHLVLWELLQCIVEAQQGICKLPPWFTTEGPSYKTYSSFVERFNEVTATLKSSKACCCSLFAMPSFAARLAWNPQREFKRKETNQHLNKAKSAFQADGKKYATKKVEKETELATSLRSRTIKRNKMSERAKLSRQLMMPVQAEDTRQETMAANEQQGFSSETQAVSTAAAEQYDGGINPFPSQMSRPAMPSLTINTSRGAQIPSPAPSPLYPDGYMFAPAHPTAQLPQVSLAPQQLQVAYPQQQPPQQVQTPQHQGMSQQTPLPYYPQFPPQAVMYPGYRAHGQVSPQFSTQQPQWHNAGPAYTQQPGPQSGGQGGSFTYPDPRGPDASPH
ncbi:hypothetical protein F4678DRAFT_465798 [Xylaria arbuscula]|nr:hypothetical protein F4678DRAFT_465798 [Xylaria arbuscula]